jgi:hypothetical protein
MGQKLILNAPLSVDDVVICKQMDDFVIDRNTGNKVYNGIPMGMRGKVDKVTSVGVETHYGVEWQNGGKLSLIDLKVCKECDTSNNSKSTVCENCGSTDLKNVDEWWKVENNPDPNVTENFRIKKRQITESNEKLIYKFLDFANQFGNKKNTLNNFLQDLKNSGFVNMLGASPFLYMGEDEFKRQYHHRIKEIQNMKCEDLNTDEEIKSCEDEKENLEILISLIEPVRNIMINSGYEKISDNKSYDVDKNPDEFYSRLKSIIQNNAKEYIKLWAQTSMFRKF